MARPPASPAMALHRLLRPGRSHHRSPLTGAGHSVASPAHRLPRSAPVAGHAVMRRHWRADRRLFAPLPSECCPRSAIGGGLGCVDASAWAYARLRRTPDWSPVPAGRPTALVAQGISTRHDQTLWDSATGRSLAVLPVRHDGAVEDVGQRAHAAIVAGDWSTVRLLLHPYLHWTDSTGGTIRGRAKVLAMLEHAAQAPAQARSIELRDGQIYRWLA